MIVIVSGSIRPGSNALKVAQHLDSRYRAAGAETALLDLRTLPPEAYQGEAYAKRPEAVTKGFVEPVLAADGLVVVVPEYNGSYPGALKHFVDLLPFPESFENRPVAFVGIAAGYYGGLRAVEQLQMVFAYRNGLLFNKRVFIPAVYGMFDEDNNIKDEAIRERLENQSTAFLTFVGEHRRPG
jgi:NAD(P)H-dependent FMN reductase